MYINIFLFVRFKYTVQVNSVFAHCEIPLSVSFFMFHVSGLLHVHMWSWLIYPEDFSLLYQETENTGSLRVNFA